MRLAHPNGRHRGGLGVAWTQRARWSWPETRRRVGRRQAIPDRTRSPGKRWVEAELLDELCAELLDELCDATGLRTG